MQRTHPHAEPLPLRQPHLDAERVRIKAATAAFLAQGGEIEQLPTSAYEHAPSPRAFVINAERTPVYAHLFEQPPAPVAKPKCARVAMPELAPIDTQAGAEVADSATADDKLAGQVLEEAALGLSPSRIARRLGLTEKRVRQLCRDYHINFCQR